VKRHDASLCPFRRETNPPGRAINATHVRKQKPNSGKESLMMHSPFRLASVAVLLASFALAASATAQDEIPPPQGKGHVVVFISGLAGPKHDKPLTEAIAALGYDVVVYDGRNMEAGQGGQLRADIQQAQQMPHALPGKVALVGLSMGGGFSLAYGSHWPDLVAVDIVWYPATVFALRMPTFVSRITVPVLMFAGEADDYKNCCLIGTARSLAADAAVVKAPFELVTYPGVHHDFIKGGSGYNAAAYNDAFNRTAAKLKAAFAD
jgi:pimeloyl-ACP methyl ester carboxylesterase